MPDDTHTATLHPSRLPATVRVLAAPPRAGRRTVSTGALLTILLHALLLWWILMHQDDIRVGLSGNRATETTLVMIPNTPDTAAKEHRAKGVEKPAPKQPAPIPSKAHTRPSKPARRPAPPPPNPDAISVPAAAPTPPALAEEKPAPPAPEEDFSTRLAARQRQRAEAEAQEREAQVLRGSPESQDNERGKQAALANIQRAVRAAGISKDDIGGVFGVQDVGAHHAQLVFHGWRTTSSRRISQLFEIEQGGEPDIRVALIKKVIAIIRAEKPGDFPWESHRLGREITLSARPADQAGLEQFLMREFFPDYAR